MAAKPTRIYPLHVLGSQRKQSPLRTVDQVSLRNDAAQADSTGRKPRTIERAGGLDHVAACRVAHVGFR